MIKVKSASLKMADGNISGRDAARRDHAFELISRSPEQTRQMGSDLGELAQKGDFVLLVGNLGAGKTCFTQGIAKGVGFDGYAASPSFVLVREYEGRLKVYHIDFYRLDSVEEIADLGIDDSLSSDGVSVVEWADKALDYLPREHLLIEFAHCPAPEERRLRFEPHGKRYIDLAGRLEEKWNLR